MLGKPSKYPQILKSSHVHQLQINVSSIYFILILIVLHLIVIIANI